MPPPLALAHDVGLGTIAALSVRVELVMVSVPTLKTPPPLTFVPVTLPLATVIPEIFTLNDAAMSNTREALFPLTVMTSAPGPAMVRSLTISNSPVIKVIGPAKPGSKFTAPPEGVSISACRSEPKPESLRFITVLGSQRSSSTSRCRGVRRLSYLVFLRLSRGNEKVLVFIHRRNELSNMVQFLCKRDETEIPAPKKYAGAQTKAQVA